jgi:hypothetical protein
MRCDLVDERGAMDGCLEQDRRETAGLHSGRAEFLSK